VSDRRRRYLLASLAAVALAAGASYLLPRDGHPASAHVAPEERAFWDKIAQQRVGLFNPVASAGEPSDDVRNLAALGYLQGYQPPSEGVGVVRHEPGLVSGAYSLYSSAHAPEAFLVDLRGRVVQRWRYEFDRACPGRGAEPGDLGRTWWRRVRLLPNGDLLAIFDYLAVIRLDRDSRLLWARCAGYHHDLVTDREGRILILKAELGELETDGGPRTVVEEFVERLSAEGEPEGKFSLLAALAESPHRATLLGAPADEPDLLHANSLVLLRGRIPSPSGAFAAGNLLVSMRALDLVAAFDPARRSVTWALVGPWRAQHEATETEEGTLVVFSNLDRNGSRVVEVDPRTEQVVWSYEDGFSSPVCGASQRLSNGNTMVVDSTGGRAFEVTRGGRVVWEFRSPHRIRREGQVLVALLPALERLERDAVEPWLAEPR
jgi:hypothetical protein